VRRRRVESANCGGPAWRENQLVAVRYTAGALLPLNGRAGETATELGVINRADPTTARASARRRRATNTGTSSSSTYARPSAPPPAAAQSRQRKPHQSSACEELRATTGNISRSCSLRSRSCSSSSSSSGSVQWRTQRRDPR